MTTVVGYAYHSEVSCPNCTLADLEYGELRVPMYTDDDGYPLEVDDDNNGIPYETFDYEGNRIGAVFAGAEWDYPLHCNCGEVLDISIILLLRQ